jgi:hypothetical protein
MNTTMNDSLNKSSYKNMESGLGHSNFNLVRNQAYPGNHDTTRVAKDTFTNLNNLREKMHSSLVFNNPDKVLPQVQPLSPNKPIYNYLIGRGSSGNGLPFKKTERSVSEINHLTNGNL